MNRGLADNHVHAFLLDHRLWLGTNNVRHR
ncbi:two-component regulator propeller domain-containing protein [Leeia oryzae]